MIKMVDTFPEIKENISIFFLHLPEGIWQVFHFRIKLSKIKNLGSKRKYELTVEIKSNLNVKQLQTNKQINE